MKNRLVIVFSALALASLSIVLGLSSVPGEVGTASAEVDCNERHRLRIDIIDDATGELLMHAGTRVEISPDPRDGDGNRTYVDNGDNDDNDASGRIDERNACEVTDSAPSPPAYRIAIRELPADCQAVGDDRVNITLTSNSVVTFHVRRCSAPSNVDITVRASQDTLACGSTTSLTIRVQRDGRNVPDGTEVRVSASLGSVAPRSLTTENGGAFATYRAPNSESGVAIVTVEALGRSTSIRIRVTCDGGGPGVPAQLNFPSTVCANRANVTFSWTPVSGASVQWLDLSLFDNNFVPGTYIPAGPLSPGLNQLSWNGLLRDLPHYWRVTALTDSGWLVSATGAFVPCGGPELRGTSYRCTGGGRASVTFFWAPPSPSASSTWLDLTLFNNAFAPNTFIGAGPLGNAQQLTWNGILVNLPHYWRVNSFIGYWAPSNTGTFYAAC